LMAKLES